MNTELSLTDIVIAVIVVGLWNAYLLYKMKQNEEK